MDRTRSKQVVVLTHDQSLHQRMEETLASAAGYNLLERTSDLNDVYALGVQGALHLILVDWRFFPLDPLMPVRELRQRLPDVPLAVVTEPTESDYIRRALLSGARSFLPIQFTRDNLIQTIDDLTRADGIDRGPGRNGKVAAVFSLKGGVGRTLIASNLAVALRRGSKQPTVLVDGKVFHGDVEVALNLNPQHNIGDLISQMNALDPDLVDEALANHASGVRVLAATNLPEMAERIRGRHLSDLLRLLRTRYLWVVVDAGAYPDERLDAILDSADVILLVATPEMPSLRAARVFLQMARQQGGLGGKAKLVVNRADLVGGVPLKEIERSLGLSVYAALADDAPLATYSLNRGVPLVTSHERKPLARGIQDLALSLVEELTPAAKQQEKGGFRLFRRGGG